MLLLLLLLLHCFAMLTSFPFLSLVVKSFKLFCP
jgi:hypothetical protein